MTEHTHSHDRHNHDHNEHESHQGCSHEHHHHKHPPVNDNMMDDSTNHGLFKSIFSKVSGKTGHVLQAHRKKILFGTAAACAATETMVTNNAPVLSLPLLGLAAVLSHDAGEDVLEQISELKHSQGLSAGVVGTAIGFGHTLRVLNTLTSRRRAERGASATIFSISDGLDD